METLTHIFNGFAVCLQPINLWYTFIGVFMGTIIGVLPGIGPSAGIALLIPVTFGMNPTSALIMMCGIYYGTKYGGSTTAILIRTPGEAASVMTSIPSNEVYQAVQATQSSRQLAELLLAEHADRRAVMGVQVFDALDLVARVRAADEAFASEDEQGDARVDVVRRGAAKPLDERTCVAAAERTQLAGEDHGLAFGFPLRTLAHQFGTCVEVTHEGDGRRGPSPSFYLRVFNYLRRRMAR